MASKKNSNTVLVIGGAALLLWFLFRDKKPKGKKPIIEYLDSGFRSAPDTAMQVNTGSNSQTGRVTHVGVLPVSYMAGNNNGNGIGSQLL